jgi:diaminopimelate decarboxylase
MSAAPSRFGIDPAVLPGILEKIRAHESFLELDGYHFHLSGYSTDERIAALESAVSILKQTQARGFACRMINMGGGLAMRYVDAEQWRSFLAAKNSAEFLGERKINDFYPYGNEVSGSEQLATILHGRKECHARIQDVLREHNVRLAIEPGRCLLDQAGITCMTIKGVKIASDGMLLVDVDANINHLSEQWFGSEYCVDPLHLPRTPATVQSPVQAAIGGNTCLEIDVLSWRKICFQTMPRAGDILIYANTAGYQMDSNESSFHRLPIPEKVAVYKENEAWKWKKDAEYSFLDPK